MFSLKCYYYNITRKIAGRWSLYIRAHSVCHESGIHSYLDQILSITPVKCDLDLISLSNVANGFHFVWNTAHRNLMWRVQIVTTTWRQPIKARWEGSQLPRKPRHAAYARYLQGTKSARQPCRIHFPSISAGTNSWLYAQFWPVAGIENCWRVLWPT